MHDCLILGGGVIGLSLAWQLARDGSRVQVIDRAEFGQEASWAGAGILPPASAAAALHPYDQLRALSYDLHADWAARLLAETGIDNGFRRCGGIYLARTAGEAAALSAWAQTTAEEQIEVARLSPAMLAEIEPGLASQPGAYRTAFHLPGENQLRNPRHVKALYAACQQAGVEFTRGVEATGFQLSGSRVEAIETTAGPLAARSYCVTAGSWTQRLLGRLGIATGILPIRGQIVLFRAARPPITHVINEGSRYLVPRDDGYLLAGATEEEAGFDKRTTEEAIRDLVEFARSLVPLLGDVPIERTWAGLRPATLDGMPYLGPLPGLDNAFVAAGHFRSGIWLSPGTALVMSQLIRGQQPAIDLGPFRVGR
jgi:glycine oxidase